MNKKTKYGITGALLLAAIGGAKNVQDQLAKMPDNGQFDWLQFFRNILGWGALGGLGGAGIGAIVDYRNSLVRPLNTDAILANLASRVVLTKESPDYLRLEKKAQLLIDLLKERFKSEIKGMPYKYGSTESHSALKEDFDIDICVECYPNAFSSVEAMYFSIAGFLTTLKDNHGIVDVRTQTKSIGVFFNMRSASCKIDVVPKKLSHTAAKDKSGYLYLNKQGIFEDPSRTKTNIPLLSSVKLTDTQNKILVILKTFKKKNGIVVSSHLLKMLIKYAYQAYRGDIPKKFTDKFIMVLQYIADNIESLSIRGIENTNNIITKSMSAFEKTALRNFCLEVIEEYRYQPNSIIKYF